MSSMRLASLQVPHKGVWMKKTASSSAALTAGISWASISLNAGTSFLQNNTLPPSGPSCMMGRSSAILQGGYPMSEQIPDASGRQEPRKISLAEAVRRKLAEKQEIRQNERQLPRQRSGNQTLKSQMTKKVNNQRRRTGGS
jgi:hypothetical protein